MQAVYRKKSNEAINTVLQNSTNNTNSKHQIDYNQQTCLNNDEEINNLTPQSKGTGWQNEWRNIIHFSTKEIITALNRGSNLKWKDRKSIPSRWHQNTSRCRYLNIWQDRLQSKLIRRYKVHLILIKETVNQEYIAILNTHAPNSGKSNFIKEYYWIKNTY